MMKWSLNVWLPTLLNRSQMFHIYLYLQQAVYISISIKYIYIYISINIKINYAHHWKTENDNNIQKATHTKLKKYMNMGKWVVFPNIWIPRQTTVSLKKTNISSFSNWLVNIWYDPSQYYNTHIFFKY